MTPMPKAAQVIAKVIRAKVKRPKRLPQYHTYNNALRFNMKRGQCCPMGLLPGAKRTTPAFVYSFNKSPGTQEQIELFWRWWDSQTNPQQAVDAVWGKDKGG